MFVAPSRVHIRDIGARVVRGQRRDRSGRRRTRAQESLRSGPDPRPSRSTGFRCCPPPRHRTNQRDCDSVDRATSKNAMRSGTDVDRLRAHVYGCGQAREVEREAVIGARQPERAGEIRATAVGHRRGPRCGVDEESHLNRSRWSRIEARPSTRTPPPGCRETTSRLPIGSLFKVWQPRRLLAFPAPELIAKAHTVCGPGPTGAENENPWALPNPGKAPPTSGRRKLPAEVDPAIAPSTYTCTGIDAVVSGSMVQPDTSMRFGRRVAPSTEPNGLLNAGLLPPARNRGSRPGNRIG